MKFLTALRQPNGMGVGLFIAAGSVLIAIIIASHVGLPALARTLSQLAQPLCACAVAVLLYLALCEQPASTQN